jgi:hypothetical protein
MKYLPKAMKSSKGGKEAMSAAENISLYKLPDCPT